MEFTIEKQKEKRKKEPHYIFEIEFMFGDADGEDFSTLIVNEDKLDTLKPIILAAACCCAAYPGGRGGGDEYTGLPDYDAFFNENGADPDDYEDLLEDSFSDEQAFKKLGEHMNSLNPFETHMEHPWDPTGGDMHASFRYYNLFFVNADGDKSKVKITFNEEELAEIERAKKHFK